jgi:YVTN family beta-propeller protein
MLHSRPRHSLIFIAPFACAITAAGALAGAAAPARAVAPARAPRQARIGRRAGDAAPPTLAPSMAAVSPSAYPDAWVVSYSAFSLQPIDTRTNTAGKQIKLTPCCNYLPIAITPDGATAYVAQYFGGSNQMYPVDLATGKVGAPITVGVNITDIAITPDGRTAYVTYTPNAFPPFNGFLVAVDLATRTVGTPIPVGLNPNAVALTPDGETAYVVNEGRASDSVTPVNLATATTSKAIKVGIYPSAIAITPNGKTAYVTNSDYLKANSHDTVTPINLATNKAEKPITVGPDPTSIAITASGATAYVTTYHNIRPINLASRKVGKPITLGAIPGDLAISPVGSTLYSIEGGSRVVPISLPTRKLGKPIKVTKDPSTIVFAPGWYAPSGPASKASLGPALAVFRSSLYEASTSASGKVGFAVRHSAWSAIRTVRGSWGTAHSNHAPALAVFGGRLYAFWTATKGKIQSSSFNGSSWSVPRAVGGSWGTANTIAGPSATTTASGSALYVAWTTRSGSVSYSDFTGTTWAKQATAVSKVTSDAPAIAGIADGPNTPPSSSTIAFAWTGKTGAVSYGRLTTSGFKDLGAVAGPVSDAAPALGYAGTSSNGNLYLASAARSSGKISYQAIFHVAQSSLVPGDWTAAEFEPQASATAGPALAASGYVVYLGWQQRGTSEVAISSALNPY